MTGQPSRELTRQERAAIRRLVTDLCANHDNQDRLCLPLDCPCYMLQKWWTGSFCRYFRAAVLPVDPALESAITGESIPVEKKAGDRAGTQAPDQKKLKVICPQLNQNEA